MKIGIFDSGMGGLSVLHRALRMIPEADFLYYADEEHVPYGEKTREQVRGYIDEIIAFMIKKQVDAIVIACNTATSVATKEYRSQFPLPIVGMEPAVKKAVEEYADRPGRILVAATPITIQGDKLHHLVDRVDKRDMVDLVALPKLVRFAEQEIFDQDQIVPYLKEALKDYPLEEYKAFVLGCTHFNYFKESYQEIFPNKIEFVDGNEGALRELIRRMEKECDTISVKNGANDAEEFSKTDRVTYYFSGKQISAADQIRIDKYMCQLDRMALIPVVICQLEAGERMITEGGGMSWMSPNMKMETTTNGGIGKAVGRMFSGEKMFQNIYTAQGGNGMIAFASCFPGSIRAFDIRPGQEMIFQKSAFLASEAGVQLSVHFHKKVASGLFGGEGFVLQKVSGQGVAFAEFDGHVVEYELQPGQQIVIDTGHLAAMTASCQMDIQTVPGVKNMLFGGQGLFNTVITGPGRVWLQTMPISNVAGALRPYIPSGS